MTKRNHIREAIIINKAYYAVLEWLKEEKVVVEAKLKSFKVAYLSQKKQIQDIVLQLGSNDKLL